MAEENQSSAEKSEEPTPKRLEKAREDGQTVRSKELNTTAVLLAGGSGLLIFGPAIARQLSNVMAHNFVLARQEINDAALVSHLYESIVSAAIVLIPFFLLLLAVTLLSPSMLGGWNLTFKAISPKASRMNPMSGLGRMFGSKAPMELFKALAKVLVVASVAILVQLANSSSLLSIHGQAVLPAMGHAVQLMAWSFLVIAASMLVITAIDIPFQIQSHTQKLRMTLQQVKDELKETDGRPEVKQKIRQLQQQLASNRMLEDVPQADVVITNPDHYAVALRYDQAREGAPRLLAKGGDHMAARIKQIAGENDVPVVSSPALARAIFFNTHIGDEIPAGLYIAVAQVLAYIYQLRQWARGQGGKPRLSRNLEIPHELRRD